MRPVGKKFHGQAGVSMVEILVALAVGLFLTAGMIQLYVSSRQSYRSEESFARLQENGRFALDVIARDLRMHGNLGCRAIADIAGEDVLAQGTDGTTQWGVFNPVADIPIKGGSSEMIWAFFGVDRPLGYQLGSATAEQKALVAPSDSVTWSSGDALALAGTFSSGVYVTRDMASWDSPLELSENPGNTGKGDVLLVTDCEAVDILEVTNDPRDGLSFEHDKGKANGWNRSGELSRLYRKDSEAMINAMAFPFVFRTYFIGTGADGLPSLYVSNLHPTNGREVQRLVDNIEDMRVQFGVDTDNNGAPDTYRLAGAVAANEWARVLSARIEILARTDDNVFQNSQSYAFNGALVTASDRRQRAVFASTVALRPAIAWRSD